MAIQTSDSPDATARGSQRQRAHQQVADLLKRRISKGRYPPGARLPTERDLAQELGVSRATVRQSMRALAQEKLVYSRRGSGNYVIESPPDAKRPDNRTRRWTIAVAMLYTSPDSARSSDLVLRQLYGAESAVAARHANLQLSFGPSTHTHDNIERFLDERIDGVDGVLMCGNMTTRTIAQFQCRCPTVVIMNFHGEQTPARADFHAVMPDYFGGGAQIAEHLLSLGHRHVMILPGAVGHHGYAERQRGCQAVFDAAKGRVTTLPTNIYFDLTALRQTFTPILQKHDRPTALIAPDDASAVRADHVLKQLGVQIPDDLSLVGFDNRTDMNIGDDAHPFTTVAVPCEEVGRLGLQRLIEIIERPDENTPCFCHVQTRLIVRQSTARTTHL